MISPHATSGPVKVEAVIFDLDGTLLDSAAHIATAINSLMKEQGLRNFDAEEIAHHIGWGSRKLVETTFASRGVKLSEALLQAIEARYLERYAYIAARESKFFPDAVTLVRMLSGGGIRIGLCTNKPEAIARNILENAGLSALFGAIVGGDSGFGLKPSPEPLIATREQMGIKAEHSVFVGDSIIDYHAAEAATVRFILVCHPNHPCPENLVGTVTICSQLTQILPVIWGQNEAETL